MSLAGFSFSRCDAASARPIVDDLVRVYREVYADGGEFDSEERYREQLDGHMGRAGWELVAAWAGGDLAGYVYGFPLARDSRWWRGLLTPAGAGAIEETGSRTFALCELMVRASWRGRGLGHALHDEILARREEERATLLVEPDNGFAVAAYTRWGWERFGKLKPGWDGAPEFDALILPLGARW